MSISWRRLRLILLPVPFALAASCRTVQPVTLPNGARGYSVSCDSSRIACYQAAKEQCPAGYISVENFEGHPQGEDGFGGEGSGHESSRRSASEVNFIFSCRP